MLIRRVKPRIRNARDHWEKTTKSDQSLCITGIGELIANLVVLTKYKPILVEEIDPSQKQRQALIKIGAEVSGGLGP